MEYKIEKGIPIPSTGKTGMTETLRAMEVGDSVLFSQYKIPSEIGGAITVRLKAEGKMFIRRAVEGGVRVWRIE